MGQLPSGWTWFLKRLLTGAWKCTALGPADVNRSSSRGELVHKTNHTFNTRAQGESGSPLGSQQRRQRAITSQTVY